MDDSGNKKSSEGLFDEKVEAAAKGELTDEELAGVTGGDLKDKLKRKIKELLFTELDDDDKDS